ncbi:MAG: hypothetical protein ACXVKT_13190 [Flavisolibacter sp.]
MVNIEGWQLDITDFAIAEDGCFFGSMMGVFRGKSGTSKVHERCAYGFRYKIGLKGSVSKDPFITGG